jgi:hypothetical protein
VIAFDRRLRFDGRGSGGTNMQTNTLRTLVFLASAAMLTSAVAFSANALTLNVIGGNDTEVNRLAHRGENDGRVRTGSNPIDATPLNSASLGPDRARRYVEIASANEMEIRPIQAGQETICSLPYSQKALA